MKHLMVFVQDDVGVINFCDKRLQGSWLFSSAMQSKKVIELCHEREVSFVDKKGVVNVPVLERFIDKFQFVLDF